MLASRHYPSQNSGLPLVMLHGFLCGGSFFSENIRELSKYFPIYTIDLPGYAESVGNPYRSTILEMAYDVIATINSLNIGHFHLLGHSMGGMVALQIAVLETSRIQKLIPFATNCQGNEKERFETYEESKMRIQNGYDHAKKEIIATWFVKGSKHPEFQNLLKLGKSVTVETAKASLDAMAEFNLSKPHLNLITAKTLIIGAQFDRTYTYKTLSHLQSQLPKAHFILIKGVSHNAHLENPQKFNEILIDFIN